MIWQVFLFAQFAGPIRWRRLSGLNRVSGSLDGGGPIANHGTTQRIVQVDDEKGSPIAGATIENMGNSSKDVRRGKTDDRGIARLEDLHSSYRGTIATGGHTANGRQVLADPQEDRNLKGLEIKAAFGGSVKVSVDREKHHKAYSVQVMAQDPFAPFGHTEKNLDDGGKDVVFDRLPPGKYNISIQEKPVAKGNNMFEVKSLKGEVVNVVEKIEASVEFR